MSAIGGVFYRDGKVASRSILQSMVSCMIHRGPDGSSVTTHDSVGLVHGMLFSTPESIYEMLPTPCLVGNLLITADLRIDNRDELFDRLYINRGTQEVITDSTLVLHAYRKWGNSCANYLIGDFAFAIWDEQLKQLFCARDHLGVKPFYYYASESLFAFASELSALLLIPEVPQDVREERIADFVVFNLEGIDKTTTFYHDVFRLPPAHYIEVNPDSISTKQFWKLERVVDMGVRKKDDQQEEFNEIFSTAVNDRLRCNTSVASMLSGGLDSSAIVGVARNNFREHRRELTVYSASGTDISQCREYLFSQLIIGQGGLCHVGIRPSDIWGYEKELLEILETLREPFDGHMILPMMLYLTAKRNNSHVVLDGLDGDVSCSIPPSYPAFLLRQRKFKRAFSEIASLEENYYCYQISKTRLLFQALRKSFTPECLRQAKDFVIPQSFKLNQYIKDSLLCKSSWQNLNIVKRVKAYEQSSRCSPKQPLQDLHVEAVLHPNLTVAIERYDRVAARCSIEPRHPMLDKRLIECTVNLPWELLVREGWSKYVLRKCAEDFLPEKVCWRKGKEHVGYEFICEMQNKNQMHAIMLDVIRNEIKGLSKYVKMTVLKRLTDNKTCCKIEESAFDLLNVYSLAMWLKQSHQNK